MHKEQNRIRQIESCERAFIRMFKVAQYSIFRNGKLTICVRYFGQLLLVRKQTVFEFYKVTLEEFEFCNKSQVTNVAMATMTFQYCGYYLFEVN